MRKVDNGKLENVELNVKEIDKSKSNSMGIKKDKEETYELIQKIDVENTPFIVVTVEGKSFGAMGQHRITEMMETAEEVSKELEKFSWNRLVQVMMILTEKLK